MNVPKVVALNCIVAVAVVALLVHHGHQNAPTSTATLSPTGAPKPIAIPTSAAVLAAFHADSDKVIACGYAGGCSHVRVKVFTLARNNNYGNPNLAGKINIEISSGIPMSDLGLYTAKQRAAEAEVPIMGGDAAYGLAASGQGYDLVDGEGKPAGHDATEEGAISDTISNALLDYARGACSVGAKDWCGTPAVPKTGFPVSEDAFVDAYIKANLGVDDDYTASQLAQLARDTYTMAQGLDGTLLRSGEDARSRRAMALIDSRSPVAKDAHPVVQSER
jgi:hypothetical protein